ASALHLLDDIDEISPGNETTSTLRGVIAFLQGDDKKADEMLSKAVDPEIAGERTLEIFAANQFRLNRPYRVVKLLKDRVKDTTDVNTLALYGMAAMSADMRKEGEAALRKAIDLAPERVRFSVVLANYLATEKPDEAAKILETAYKVAPADLAVRLALVNEYTRMGKTKALQQFIDELQASDPDSVVTALTLATYDLRIGDFDAAAAAYQKAIDAGSAGNYARFGLAQVRLLQKQYADAESIYRSIADAEPDTLPAYVGILQSYLDRGMKSEGIAELTRLGQDEGRKAALVALSGYFSSVRDDDEAEKFLAQAATGNQDAQYWKSVNANLYLRKARRSLAQRNYEEARKDIFTALSSYPANRQLLGVLAQIEIQSGSLREARKVLDQMEQMHPGAQIVDVREGDLAMAQKDYGTARTRYEAAWKKEPEDRLGQGLYSAYEALGLEDKADAFVREWIKAIPDSVVARVNLAQRYVANQDIDKAISVYKDVLARIPDSETALNNIAWLYLQQGQVQSALDAGERAYRSAPKNGYVADTYGWMLFKAERLQEAEAMLSRAVSLVADLEIQGHLDDVRKAMGK
ncbi:MAG: tetratricopeptide repeat protein, partial [Pseudomonadales bacterium]|nr:tetratricopeptide repeat protein [Pseudomonadales bacterium]